jgi:LSD1 subclass zinc finger protein
MDTKIEEQEINKELNCTGCGAILGFKPGTKNLSCQYCGAENIIEDSEEVIEEIDYDEFIKKEYEKEEKVEVTAVKCTACGASITLDPNVVSDQCPYCATHIVVEGGSTSTQLKPKSLLPFKITREKAYKSFTQWIDKLWFAPSDLKKYTSSGRLEGIYVPYWTYDSNTASNYTGERGTYRYRTESYTTTNEKGETVSRTRQVRYTDWNYVTGHVANSFDDILVIASQSLPEKYTIKLEPWNLKELVPYNDKFLSGFRTESYQVDVVKGLTTAKGIMNNYIRDSVRRDIGGDDQRVHTVKTSFSNLTFKHILLPIWISSFRYKKKVFRYLINGETGEVQGERPYSIAKIALTVLAAIAVIVVAYLIFKN